MRRYGRGTDIDRAPIGFAPESRPDHDDPRLLVNSDGHFPFAVAQRLLQAGKHDRIKLEIGKLPFPSQ